MNDFVKALDQLDEATGQLVNASVELMERTQKLSQQLQELAEAIKRHNRPSYGSDGPDIREPGRPQIIPQSSEIEILAEVKRLLDGT